MFEALLADILKALIAPVVAIGLAWLVGNRISAVWAHKQKRRDQSLSTTTEFYRMYGEFFAVWKLANFVYRDSKNDHTYELPKDARWELMQRSTAVEASCEAILLRIGSELTLSEDQVRALGLFRQGVQRLRQSIVKQTILGWVSSEHLEYAAFKRLSAEVSKLAASIGNDGSPNAKVAADQIRRITANEWEKVWSKEIRRADEATDTLGARS